MTLDGQARPRIVEAQRYAVFHDLEEFPAPTVSEVLDLARSLDGHAFDQLVVTVEAGGVDCTASLHGDAESDMALVINCGPTIQRLVNPGLPSDEETYIQTGGVPTPIPKRQVVPAEEALRCLDTYLTLGTIDAERDWDEEPAFLEGGPP